MSIKVMSKVWENGPEGQGEILVLLALSDHADDKGRCWPSMKTVARKARMTERGAQKIVRRLAENGWLSVVTGGGRNGCNQYQINPEPCSPPERRSPPNVDTETPNVETLNPEPRSPEPSRTIIEPSIPPISPPPKKVCLPADWVPDEEDLKNARSLQFTEDEINEVANEYRTYWTEESPKTKRTNRGWHACWHNRCKNLASTYARNRRLRSQPTTHGSTTLDAIADAAGAF